MTIEPTVIELPEHERVLNLQYKCHVCGGTMTPCSLSRHIKRHGLRFYLEGIYGYSCNKCGTALYTPAEGKYIESVLIQYRGKKASRKKKVKQAR